MNDERNLGEKTDDSGQQPRYEHYQFHEEQGTVLKPSGPSGHRRNQNSFQKKAGATIALAVIFGLVAAVVFQAANFAADRFLNTGKSSVQIKTTDSVDLQETASDDSTADKVLSDSENGTVAAVAQASMPSVVAITTVSVQEIPSFFGYSSHQYKSASTGSGIIVGDNDDERFVYGKKTIYNQKQRIAPQNKPVSMNAQINTESAVNTMLINEIVQLATAIGIDSNKLSDYVKTTFNKPNCKALDTHELNQVKSWVSSL